MISCVWLAIKRTARSVYFPVLLLVFGLAVYFAPMLGDEEGLPTAGVVDLDGGEVSSRIVKALCEAGFELCEDEETLREMIGAGQYDCGVVLDRRIGEKIAEGELDGVAEFIETPTSFASALYQNHVVAAVYTEYAPYITASFLPETEITEAEVLAEYHRRVEEGFLFTFSVEYTDGGEVQSEDERARTYTLAAVALLVFALMMYSVCDVLRFDIVPLCGRIGMKKTLFSAVIPTMAVRVVGVILTFATAAELLYSATESSVLRELFGAVAVYTVLAASFAVVMAAALANTGRIQILSLYLLVVSLVLCPIYFDVSMLLPWIDAVRYMTPPYWLWLAVDAGGIAIPSVAAVAAVPTSLLLLYLRFFGKGARRAAK